MNAELTAENRPACTLSDSIFSVDNGSHATHKDKGRIQILVVLFRIVSVKIVGLLTIDGKEVCAGIIGPQWIEELFEDGAEAVWWVREALRLVVAAVESAHHFGSSWTRMGSFPGDVGFSP